MTNFCRLVGTLSCKQSYSFAISSATTRISNVHISNPVILTLAANTSIGTFPVSFKHEGLGALLTSSPTCFQNGLIARQCFFNRNGAVRVPSFGGILVSNGLHMGALTLYNRISSLPAQYGRVSPLIIQPVFSEAHIFNYFTPLGM